MLNNAYTHRPTGNANLSQANHAFPGWEIVFFDAGSDRKDSRTYDTTWCDVLWRVLMDEVAIFRTPSSHWPRKRSCSSRLLGAYISLLSMYIPPSVRPLPPLVEISQRSPDTERRCTDVQWNSHPDVFVSPDYGTWILALDMDVVVDIAWECVCSFSSFIPCSPDAER